MDSAADAPSNTARHTPITRRLVVAVGALFVLGILMAVAALFDIAQKLDAEDVRKTHFYIERALENRTAAAKNYIASYAYWTTGLRAPQRRGRRAMGLRRTEHGQDPVHQ